MDSSKTDVSRDEGSAAVGGRGGKSSVLARKKLFFSSHFVVTYRRNCSFMDYMYFESGVELYLYSIYR